MNRVRKFLKALGIAFKDEVEEIASIQPTDEDYQQGKVLATAAAAAMASMGCTPAFLDITYTVCKYFSYDICTE